MRHLFCSVLLGEDFPHNPLFAKKNLQLPIDLFLLHRYFTTRTEKVVGPQSPLGGEAECERRQQRMFCHQYCSASSARCPSVARRTGETTKTPPSPRPADARLNAVGTTAAAVACRQETMAAAGRGRPAGERGGRTKRGSSSVRSRE